MDGLSGGDGDIGGVIVATVVVIVVVLVTVLSVVLVAVVVVVSHSYASHGQPFGQPGRQGQLIKPSS